MSNGNGFFASLIAGLPFVVSHAESDGSTSSVQNTLATSAASMQTMF
ncbi:hypothetical protein P4N68_03325 [Corynebacterium felinum]|uniref:Uncharacterized protein n=1 Tax=Corynebacterium felinum TaxID=131318 RepID=A0ABU2B6E6_9CORY|nr:MULTISPECIES: hypothetical protein [Corynebacterium]MDF5820115.1 hypothetical protein [Corynebacterium felinum]MDO4760683.1 hypothetical protein [Corynebacterium sp.]MDR7353861.1 hypothetical protein [Corynebacterium felinum]WJY96036.1 hypothetical protein CFELI_12275 [Corynebacterium felinum]